MARAFFKASCAAVASCTALPTDLKNVISSSDPLPGFLKTSFAVYPNPTAGEVILEQKEGRQTGDLQIDVINAEGEILNTYGFPGKQEKFEVSLSEHPAGLYILRITADNFYECFRIMKCP